MIYFIVMFRLIRLITFLIIISVISGALWYQANSERLLSEAKEHIEAEISAVSGLSVTIESARLALPGSLVLENITVVSRKEPSHISHIKNITITPEIIPLVTSLRVVSSATVKGFSSENISADLTFRTASRRCRKWQDALDPELLDSIELTDGSLTFGTYSIERIRGSLELDNIALSRGELYFNWQNNAITCVFYGTPGIKGGYHGFLESSDFKLEGSVSPELDVLTVQKLKGLIFSLEVDLEGIVLRLNSDNRIYELTGTIEGDVGDLLSLVSGKTDLGNVLGARGDFSSTIDISVCESDLLALTLDADLSSDHIAFGKVEAGDIYGKLSVSEGRILIYDMTFDLMDSQSSMEFSLDTSDTTLPLSFSVNTKGVDMNSAMNKERPDGNKDLGALALSVSFTGSGRDLAAIAVAIHSTGELPEQDLFGTMTMSASAYLDKFCFDNICFDNISTGLSLDNSVLEISSLDLNCLGGSLSMKASCGLSSPLLPLSINARIEEMDASLISEAIPVEDVTGYGLLEADISLAGMGRTIKDQLRDIIPQIGKPGFTELFKKTDLLKDVNLYASIELEKLILRGTQLEKIYSILSTDKGILTISSLGFEAFEGSLNGKAEVDLSCPNYPLETLIRIKGMDPDVLFSRISGSENSAEGPMDLVLSFKGHGLYLWETAERMQKYTWDNKASIDKTLGSFFLALSGAPGFTSQQANASIALKTLRGEKLRVNDIVSQFDLHNGNLAIPFLTFSFYGGSVSTELDLDINTATLPFNLKLNISGSDLRDILRSTVDPESPTYGKLDLDLKIKGELNNMSSYTGDGKFLITRANLGPMPIIAPLLGGLYETMQKMFPAFRKIDITSANATFDIDDRKVMTNDLILHGGDICIVSEGYMDFDGGLNFAFVNELLEPEPGSEEDWPTLIRNFVTSFGSSVSRARLKGTLREQKWDFEYLDPIGRNVGKNVRDFFQGISR
jgi:hypothetical protein